MRRLSALALTTLLACGNVSAMSTADIETFHHAVQTGDIAKVSTMLKNEPELATSTDKFGFQPMSLQDMYFDPAIFKMLLAAGADVNAANNDGITLLHIISDPEQVGGIVAAGGNVEARDKDGRTPLLVNMTEPDRQDVIEALIDAGADVNAKDNGGATALSMARQEEDDELVAMLIKAGASE